MASLALKLKPTQGCQARQPILRVKTGCLTCRSRKKKCDETKPVCIGCERNGFLCEWPSRTTSSDRRAHKRRRGARSDQDTSSSTSTSKDAHRHAVGGHHRPPSFDRRCTPDRGNTAPGTGTAGEQSTITFSAHEVDWPLEELFSTSCDTVPSLAFESGQSSASTGSGRSPGTTASTVSPASSNVETEETQPTEYDPGPSDFGGFDIINTKSTSIADRRPVISSEENFALDLSMAAFAVESTNASLDIVPASMPLLSDTQEPTYDLLSFYISRTARSMGNGSTETNPFVSQLIPLAFANKFILGLVLCQSAVHRATEDSSQFAVAQTYYNKSLRSFRQSIDEYISGQEVSPLWLALGALIMCFTETAKGDLHGSVFDHIEAAGPLLSRLMTHSANLPNDLKNFIVEYYVDLVTISMISVDPSFGSTLVLDSQFEVMAEAMVKDGYVGQLCGTWLELLLLVPRIFDFARLSSSTIAADRFIVFSDLQSRIVSFTSSAPSHPESVLCGYIFKHAVHILLLTALNFGLTPEGQAKQHVENCVTEAFGILLQLPPDARINTSLCWAMAVIGSCVCDDIRQTELSNRLTAMYVAVGLGNIRATRILLQKIWKLPLTERTPWIISRVMRENEIWISFV